MSPADRYQLRGVSAQKEDVHRAVANLDKGLFPNAFCRIYPDVWGGDPDWCNLMHADGAGTKSIIAYLYWRETGDLSVWADIAIDAIVMNLDDLLCVGATGPFTYSSTLGRNKGLIPGAVIETIIQGTQTFFDDLQSHGVNVYFMGGETADVGDVVRTIHVDGTLACRMRRDRLVTTDQMQPGDVIVSLASAGQASYESRYNSGIGSNGLTSARHDLLQQHYKKQYPESVDPHLPDDVVYNGNYRLQDTTPAGYEVAHLLLSPTRTYAPLMMRVLALHREKLHGIIHCSGGGQSKCLHYLPGPLRVVKNNLLPIPPVFNLIQESANTSWQEMYQVFNMGQRLECFTDELTAASIIALANEFEIDAQITGFIEAADQKEVLLQTPHGTFVYH